MSEKDTENRTIIRMRAYMTRRYILALLIIAVLSSTSYFFISSIIKIQKNSSTVINIAGRQRMLSQQIALYTEWLVNTQSEMQRQNIRENLRNDLRLMENAHHGLTHGNETMNLPRIRSQAVHNIYYNPPYDLDKKVNSYISHAKALLATPTSDLDQNNPHLKAILKVAPKNLLDSLNSVVEQYEKEVQNHIYQLQKQEFYIFSLILGVLVGLMLFVFGPMVSYITKHYRELYNINRSKSDFLATMSHEIRTPMNGIVGSVELLLNGKLGEDETRHARTILYSAEALLDVINDILDFSKIETGQIILEESSFNMEVLLQDSIRLFVLRAQEKNIELIMRYKPDTPEFFTGDAGRIKQIISNIASNAIKFSDDGYVLVTVEKTHPGNRHHPGKTWIKVSIEDTGIGVPEEKRTLIFDKFTQADSGSTQNYSGTGLGLAICKSLVEIMGGEIGVKSVTGEGSVFWFTIPLMVHHFKKEKFVPSYTLKGLKILVVDDIEINRQLMEEQFKEAGLACITCTNAQDALTLLRDATQKNDPFQLAVLDFMMPDMDGELLARQIKSTPEEIKDLPLIVLTSVGRHGHIHRFSESGFSAVLTKPTYQADMLKTIHQVLNSFNKGSCHGLISIEGNLLSEKSAEKFKKGEGTDFSELIGERILLIEDNRTNRLMAQEMLEDMGCIASVAENGEIGVEMLKESSFDLILMDCQMPVMDGFETTGRIRHLETTGKLSTRTSIVALTANTMKGDKEKCLRSGMDDYLSKPIRKYELQVMLEKWLLDKNEGSAGIEKETDLKEDQKNSEKGISIPSVEETEEDIFPILNEEILSEACHMMKKRFPDMIKFYLEDTTSYLKTIRGGLDESDIEKIIAPAHTIKSSSKQIGAILVSEIAKDIEVIARDISNDNGGDMAVISEKLEELTLHFKKTKMDLKKYLDSLQRKS